MLPLRSVERGSVGPTKAFETACYLKAPKERYSPVERGKEHDRSDRDDLTCIIGRHDSLLRFSDAGNND